MNRAPLRLPTARMNARGYCSAGIVLLLCFGLATCGGRGRGGPDSNPRFASGWQPRGVLAALREPGDERVKEQVLQRLAYDGGLNDHFTNAAPVGRPPVRYSAPELAEELVRLVDDRGELSAAALKGLAALELNDGQLRALAEKANPTPVLRQTGAVRNSASDEKRRNVYLGSLRALTAHADRARGLAGKISEVLEQEQAPGLKDAPESARPKLEAEWEIYQADAAQALLAIGGDLNPYLDRVIRIWERLNSPAHIRGSEQPHERLLSPCALGASNPERLAPVFAGHISREANASTFLLVESLMGLACTGTRDPAHLQLVASVFNSRREQDEPVTPGGRPLRAPNVDYWEKYRNHWLAARPESVRSAAAAALIRLGAAGQPEMPPIKEVLAGIDLNIDESSLPGSQWLRDKPPAEFREALESEVGELLAGPDERLRAVAARLLADLWVAGDCGVEVAEKLLDPARANGDAESLRALLLIAHTDRAPESFKAKVRDLFHSLLTQEQGAKREAAVAALGGLYVKDESPRIRSGVTTYVPVPMDAEFAKALAPALSEVYKAVAAEASQTGQEGGAGKKAAVLRALGSLRSGGGEQVLTLIAGEDLRAAALQQEALDAAARGGPFKLGGVCQLLGMSVKDASTPESARAAAYYVSDGDETQRLLIAVLGPQPPGGRRNRSAEEEGAQLSAILKALDEGNVSKELRAALGQKTVELAKAAGSKRNESLLLHLADKYTGTSFAAEITKAVGSQERRPSRWYYALGLLLCGLVTWLLWFRHGLVKDPLRKLRLYQRVPELPISISNVVSFQLPLRPLVGFFLRPFSRRVLDAWVEKYVPEARTQYRPFCQKTETWPHAVKVNTERLDRLETRNLRYVFTRNLVFTVITGRHAKARTKLACLLGWWAMAEQAEGRLCDQLMLPVLINASSELLDEQQKERDPFLDAVSTQLRLLIMERENIERELLLQLLKKGRVLVIIDGLAASQPKMIKRFVSRLGRYPVNACVVTSPRIDVFDPPPKDIIYLDT